MKGLSGGANLHLPSCAGIIFNVDSRTDGQAAAAAGGIKWFIACADRGLGMYINYVGINFIPEISKTRYM